MSPEDLVACVDFRYITDAITPDEAVALLRERFDGRAAREAAILRDGYPAYTTSVGWLGYDDDEVVRRCHEAIAAGFTHFKMKVGGDPDQDARRAALIRSAIGRERRS